MPLNVLICLKVLWSGVGMVDGRGKLGGTVMTKNRSGAAARVKVTPVNRRTSFQQQQRVQFGSLSSGFRALTASQVAAWNAAASAGFPSNNIFGNPIHGSGLNLFVGLNANLLIADEAIITDPPIAESVSSPTSMAPAAAAGANTMFANLQFGALGDVVPAGTAIAILGTPPVSNGVSFVKSQLRQFDLLDPAADSGTFNLRAAYVARFGALVAGQKIFLQAVAINTTTGQAGPPLLQSLVVAA